VVRGGDDLRVVYTRVGSPNPAVGVVALTEHQENVISNCVSVSADSGDRGGSEGRIAEFNLEVESGEVESNITISISRPGIPTSVNVLVEDFHPIGVESDVDLGSQRLVQESRIGLVVNQTSSHCNVIPDDGTSLGVLEHLQGTHLQKTETKLTRSTSLGVANNIVVDISHGADIDGLHTQEIGSRVGTSITTIEHGSLGGVEYVVNKVVSVNSQTNSDKVIVILVLLDTEEAVPASNVHEKYVGSGDDRKGIIESVNLSVGKEGGQQSDGGRGGGLSGIVSQGCRDRHQYISFRRILNHLVLDILFPLLVVYR
jgi:hypothetical protein